MATRRCWNQSWCLFPVAPSCLFSPKPRIPALVRAPHDQLSGVVDKPEPLVSARHQETLRGLALVSGDLGFFRERLPEDRSVRWVQHDDRAFVGADQDAGRRFDDEVDSLAGGGLPKGLAGAEVEGHD